jgi:FHS family L-fucose permease-like MFS transporter
MPSATPQATTIQPAGTGNYTIPLLLMVSLYFAIGFITSLNDILVPHFKLAFHLTNVLALLVQMCFFGAYFVMSVPSGWIIGRIGSKSGIVAALLTMSAGLLLFLPASILISYPLFLFALFVVGSGLALLQVAINPYVGALGKPETAAARLNLCGFLNSFASTIAPRLGAAFIFIAAGATTIQRLHSVRVPYLLLALAAALMAALFWFVKLPELIEKATDVTSTDLATGKSSAWQFRNLRLGALAIFFYVGVEVAIGSLMINFLGQPSMGSMSQVRAANYVSLYWGGAMVARLLGFFVLQKVRDQRALLFVAILGCIAVAITIFGHGPLALWAIVSCGLFNSVMWPCIFPMSVEGLGRFTSQGSGILITMVVGGAIIPEAQGWLADHYGYQHSYAIVLLCYAYIVFFALSYRKPQFALAD